MAGEVARVWDIKSQKKFGTRKWNIWKIRDQGGDKASKRWIRGNPNRRDQQYRDGRQKSIKCKRNNLSELWYNPCRIALDYGAGREAAWLVKGVQKLVEDTMIKTSFCCCPGFKLKLKAIAFYFSKKLFNWCWTSEVEQQVTCTLPRPNTTTKTSAK